MNAPGYTYLSVGCELRQSHKWMQPVLDMLNDCLPGCRYESDLGKIGVAFFFQTNSVLVDMYACNSDGADVRSSLYIIISEVTYAADELEEFINMWHPEG